VEANSTGGQGSRRAVAPSDDVDDDWFWVVMLRQCIWWSYLQASGTE
jgi:hypothetical protein